MIAVSRSVVVAKVAFYLPFTATVIFTAGRMPIILPALYTRDTLFERREATDTPIQARQQITADTAMSIEYSRRPFTVAEYDQMVATGILRDDDRVELIEDTQKKAPLYAKAGIRELWVVDLNTKRVLVYTRPRAGQYSIIRSHNLGDRFTSQRFAGIVFKVRDLLP